MLKFSTILNEGEWDANPSMGEMQKGFDEVVGAAKSGKLRRAKVAYGRDSEGQIIKAVVVFDSKKYGVAREFIHDDGCIAEELHSVGDVNKLLESIKTIIGKAQKESEEYDMVVRGEVKKQEVVGGKRDEVVETSPETAVASAQSEPVEEKNVDNKKEESECTREEVQSDSENKTENDINIPGVVIIDENTAEVATDSLHGYKLHIRAMISKETNRRKYLIFEVNKKQEELGTTSCDALFKASEVLATSSKIKHLIQDLDGQYAGQITDILGRMSMIEKKRILVPTTTLDIDACKTFEEFHAKLQHWFSEHLDDVRVGIVDIKGKTHVALVKRGKKGLNEIFQSVCKEIDPKLKSTFIKGELYRRGLLNHDANSLCKDTQLTISSLIRMELGVTNDKIMSFVFDEKIIQEWKVGYEILHGDYEEEE